MQWVLVVPVKRLATAKSRLGSLGARTRQDLALAFALDTVAAAQRAAAVVAVVAVTDDPRAGEQLAAIGVQVEPDRPDAGLNPALRHGAAAAVAAHPGHGVGALSADLPALRPTELDLALHAADGVASAMVSDRSGVGTTLLVARALADFTPRFGPRSRAAHRAAGVIEPLLGASVVSVRSDVDTDVDLWEARRLGVGPRTAAVLDAL